MSQAIGTSIGRETIMIGNGGGSNASVLRNIIHAAAKRHEGDLRSPVKDAERWQPHGGLFYSSGPRCEVASSSTQSSSV